MAQKNGDLLAQLGQAPVALRQFLRRILVVDSFDQGADFLAQALEGQGQVVRHQIGAADAQFTPAARRVPAVRLAFGRDGVAGLLDRREKLLRLLEQIVHQVYPSAGATTASRPFLVCGFQSRCRP